MRRFLPFLFLSLSLPLTPYAFCKDTLPTAVIAALDKAGIAQDSISVLVSPVQNDTPTLTMDAERSISPASTIKLLTTLIALEELGPNFRWKTQLLSDAELSKDVLKGDLILRGGGDPNLTWDKLALMLRQLRNQGVRTISGDIILDRSYFMPQRPDLSAIAFDENPNSYYTVVPDALLVNSNMSAFEIDTTNAKRASELRITSLLPMANLRFQNKLALNDAPCSNWDKSWNAPQVDVDTNRAITITLSGSYPRNCKSNLYLNILDRNLYIEHLIAALWQEMGGVWKGNVRDGVSNASARVLVERNSDTLADTIKLVNKFSDNSMARIVFMTLGAEWADKMIYADHLQAAQARVLQWLVKRQINSAGIYVENGSGLSRLEQLSAHQLAAVLSAGARSTWSPEYLASLPIAALDGSMRRRLKGNISEGQARIKTGTLKNVVAIAGYVRDQNNAQWIVVGIINSDQANKGRPVLDELISWVAGGQVWQ
jgi:serine-type D-Ala-D-Ala carboxypeptidase/endopeptidase (penicillin-binding protein 4)